MTKDTRITALIIDDELVIRQSLALFLEDININSIQAENGRIGLELFRETENIDIVLVDLRMPEMDGLEVLAGINEISPETPLIVISGTGVISDAIEALHLGAWDYLLKPIRDRSLLIHAVNNSLEKAKLIRENKEYQKHLEDMVAERTEELNRANSNLSQINLRLKHVVESTRSLSFCSDVEEFGQILLEEFASNMQAEGGSIYLKRDGDMHLIHTLDPGHAPGVIPLPFSKDSVFYKTVSSKQPVLIKNIHLAEGLSKSGWEGYKDASSIVFPIMNETGDVDGLLTLHGKNPPPFVEQDKEIGQILSAYSCEAFRAVQSTEKIKKTLREKEVLLREIHHRVKNNLNIMISLLNLKMDSVHSEKDAIEAFKESKTLIYSMAMVHEELYQSTDFAGIRIKSYIENLVKKIIDIYKPFIIISYELKIEDLDIGIVKAIPCGMILTELVTNALKHAFGDENNRGKLQIKCYRSESGNSTLSVKDNGKGLPEDIDIYSTESTGLQLVHILTDQLSGNISVKRDNGTEFILNFP